MGQTPAAPIARAPRPPVKTTALPVAARAKPLPECDRQRQTATVVALPAGKAYSVAIRRIIKNDSCRRLLHVRQRPVWHSIYEVLPGGQTARALCARGVREPTRQAWPWPHRVYPPGVGLAVGAMAGALSVRARCWPRQVRAAWAGQRAVRIHSAKSGTVRWPPPACTRQGRRPSTGRAVRRGAGGLAGGLDGFAQMAAKPPSARSWRLGWRRWRTEPRRQAARCVPAPLQVAS